MNAYGESIKHHYCDVWGQPVRRMPADPLHRLPAEFCVLKFKRSGSTWAYATCGMSDANDVDGIELHMIVDSDDHETTTVEILTFVAYYHRTREKIGLGHSVNFGIPLAPGGSCDHGLVSLPYLDGQQMEIGEMLSPRYLWLIPITNAEVNFKKLYGLEALEQRFEAYGFNYFDPHRDSII